jgi:hypothetical protein
MSSLVNKQLLPLQPLSNEEQYIKGDVASRHELHLQQTPTLLYLNPINTQNPPNETLTCLR